MFQLPVADISFQFADSDRFSLDAEYARTLALRLLRTHAPADRRQRTVFANNGSSLRRIARSKRRDEVGDADIDGARRNAPRILAMETARRFSQRFFGIVAVANLLEIGGPPHGILFAHGNAG